TSIGGVPAAGIARWNGSAWLPLGSGLTNIVSDLAIYNNDLIAAGSFGGGVARWDGSTLHVLGAGVGGGGGSPAVNSVAVFHGELIAGGYFTIAGGAPAYDFARWADSAAPWIVDQPGSIPHACRGQTAAFSVEVGGYAPSSY